MATCSSRFWCRPKKSSRCAAGRKIKSERRFFPGYVLVKMELTDQAYHLIKNTPKVTGFLGSDNKPIPITDAEAARILNQVAGGHRAAEDDRSASKSASRFASPMDRLLPSTDWLRKWMKQRSRLKVAVSIFGRPTPVELEYGQVEKVR